MGIIHKVFDDWNTNFLRTESTDVALVNAEKGDGYESTHRFEDVADGATVRVSIETALDEPTIANLDVNAGGEVRTDFYEGADISGGSEALDENLNRNSFASAESDVVVKYGVTVDTQGTKIAEGGGGGRRGVGNSVPVPGGVTSAAWILNTDDTYVFEVTNNSGSAIDITISIGYRLKELSN